MFSQLSLTRPPFAARFAVGGLHRLWRGTRSHAGSCRRGKALEDGRPTIPAHLAQLLAERPNRSQARCSKSTLVMVGLSATNPTSTSVAAAQSALGGYHGPWHMTLTAPTQ